MSYHVSAPLVITKGESGSDLYLYQGAPLPESTKSDEIKRLEDAGLIAKDSSESSDGPPAKSASKDEWVAYAEAQGDADASSKTKDELIAAYGA